jgi:Mg/Co/Ni transporter MgtE
VLPELHERVAVEDQLAKGVIRASFIPIVMSMAGNAGIRRPKMTVQGLSPGTVSFIDLGWRLSKVLLRVLANGAIAAAVFRESCGLVSIACFVGETAEPVDKGPRVEPQDALAEDDEVEYRASARSQWPPN